MLDIGGEVLVLTHDAMVEGTHFHGGADLADVAWKLVAVNLSDLAAKGAEPLGILLGHSLGGDEERFIEGLREVTEEFRVPLLGGDTVAGRGARTFGCTAIGRATHVPVPDRRGARSGDAIYVTGKLGEAMLGLEALNTGSTAQSEAYRRPRPLVAEGQALAPLVSAMMDISDGLLLDCWRMATASNVCAQLERAAIPVVDRNCFDDCVRWGDDYQLLFTAPPDAALPIAATRIGQVAPGEGGPLQLDGEFLGPGDNLGYEHRPIR